MNILTEADLTGILASPEPQVLENLLAAADRCRRNSIGDRVYFRGLVEFSNRCDRNCFYCGIRRDNQHVDRYLLEPEAVIEAALSAYQSGFHSIALQSGEVASPEQVN